MGEVHEYGASLIRIHRCSLLARILFITRHAAIARCQEMLAVSTGKLPLCSSNAHLPIQAICLAVLVRSASPVGQDLLA